MDYKIFEDKIIYKVKKNRKCTKIIKKNQKLVNEYFINNANYDLNKNLINRLNDTILKIKKYDGVEKLLKTPYMSGVLEVFRESDILIRACAAKNKRAAKWLLTMNINPNIRDEKDMTALMHASKCKDLEFVVQKLIELNEDQIHLMDENGNTALFHAVNVKSIFDILVKYSIDTNFKNNNGDTIFSYICKCNKPELIKSLLKYHSDVDFSVVNNEGRTGAMYLAESNNYTELRALYATGQELNLNYKNKNNETIVSLIINQYFNKCKDGENISCNTIKKKIGDWIGATNTKKRSPFYVEVINLARTINALIDIGCDFNCEIDNYGNTPVMFFLYIKDYVSALNLLNYCDTLDLKKCNRNGVCASDLVSLLTTSDFESLNSTKNHINIEINYKNFQKALESNVTFDSSHIAYVEDKALSFSPYTSPPKMILLQSALFEGYLARNSEDGNVYVIEKYLTHI